MKEITIETKTPFGKIFVYGPIDSTQDEKVHISIDALYVLFIHCRHHRRAYVVSTQRHTTERKIQFSFCSDPLYVLYSVKGRQFDHLKNALYYLENIHFKRIYARNNAQFLYLLLCLIMTKKNTSSNISLLYDMCALKSALYTDYAQLPEDKDGYTITRNRD